MSHQDIVQKLPKGFKTIASSQNSKFAVIANEKLKYYGVQFHPESVASVAGYRILAAFLTVCGHNTPTQSAIALPEEQVLRLDERFPGQLHP